MISLRHQIPMLGHLGPCWLFVYRAPAARAAAMLPAPLAPVTHGGCAFLNIVVCGLRELRPAFVPTALGLGYWHVAYRWHAQAPGRDSRPIEGLSFVRSDCDRWLVEKSGNLLTDFRFHRARIVVEESAREVRGRIDSPDAAASFELDRTAPATLAEGSPFRSVDEAAAFLKYRPLAFLPQPGGGLRGVRVVRDEAQWKSRVVPVRAARWQFLDGLEAELELCYEVAPIDYRWERAHALPTPPCD